MHMGGMKFKQRGREEQAEADGMEVNFPILNSKSCWKYFLLYLIVYFYFDLKTGRWTRC